MEVNHWEMFEWLLAEIGVILGLYAVIWRTFILPSKQKSSRMMDQIESLKDQQMLFHQWQEAHDKQHLSVGSKIDKLADKLDRLSETVHNIDKRLAVRENK